MMYLKSIEDIKGSLFGDYLKTTHETFGLKIMIIK